MNLPELQLGRHDPGCSPGEWEDIKHKGMPRLWRCVHCGRIRKSRPRTAPIIDTVQAEDGTYLGYYFAVHPEERPRELFSARLSQWPRWKWSDPPAGIRQPDLLVAARSTNNEPS